MFVDDTANIALEERVAVRGMISVCSSEEEEEEVGEGSLSCTLCIQQSAHHQLPIFICLSMGVPTYTYLPTMCVVSCHIYLFYYCNMYAIYIFKHYTSTGTFCLRLDDVLVYLS